MALDVFVHNFPRKKTNLKKKNVKLHASLTVDELWHYSLIKKKKSESQINFPIDLKILFTILF